MCPKHEAGNFLVKGDPVCQSARRNLPGHYSFTLLMWRRQQDAHFRCRCVDQIDSRVQLQDGIVSVSCTGRAILQKGANCEQNRLGCHVRHLRLWVCVCVCVWTFQCMSLDKWSPTFGRIVLPSSWTAKVIFLDLDSWNESTTILRYVGIDTSTDIASLLRRLSCSDENRTVM